MRKIAIFTSGDAPAAKRVTSLFNEGNRIRVVAVLADSPETASGFKVFAPDVLIFSHSDWHERKTEILQTLRDLGVEKLALEGCDPATLSSGEDDGEDEFETFILSSEEEAPREVVAAFSEKAPAIPAAPQERPRTADEEWAEALKVSFNEETAREVPPPIPDTAANRPDTANRPNPAPGHPQRPGTPGMSNGSMNPAEPMPPTYLVWSIVTTVLCCLIPGIVAIIFSSQVSTKYLSGDYEGARKSSRNAEIWIIISFVLGVLSATLTLPIALIN
ncbi:MAG: CD225/dispanin family protein [Muribaculaceae bacterium]|nr:CD225/dispanin family protein [Muribaculaceae bacterium]